MIRRIEKDDGITRSFEIETVMRAVSGDGGMTAEGYALKFDRETMIGSRSWGWREKIAREAMDGADLSDAVFNFNHDNSAILAGIRNGSLNLTVDGTGLKIAAHIIDTPTGREVFQLIKEGLLGRMSFCAVIKKSVWEIAEEDSEEIDLRTITAFGKFYDVSAVTFPAYEDTELSARGAGFDADVRMRREMVKEKQINKIKNIIGGYKNEVQK
jgi:HK97 family phage prohead protease